MASQADIEALVKKVVIAKNIHILPRGKNKNTRIRLRLRNEDMIQLIRDLDPCEYLSGPEQDRDINQKGDVWIFKKRAYSQNFYIKLKLINNNCVKVISCHIDGEVD